MENILNSKLNKGLAYSTEERQRLGIHGLLPPCVQTQEAQEHLVLENLHRIKEDIDKYTYLMHLLDRNERLFYKVLSSHVEEIMPLVYTPTVGEACIKYGFIFNQPKGMFITIKDKGHIYDVLSNWPCQNVKVICVTDGERILGLGDLGAQGMGIPVGKLALYTALAGVNPSQCLPITLDVGTNNQAYLNDPNYIGLKQKRVTGKEYDDFIEEFITCVKKRFGSTCLIQFEDFHNTNAFRLLEKYRDTACTFNDDIQGTASVALSGLLTAVKMTKVELKDCVFLFYGAGEAAIGTANLIALAMSEKGISEEQAREKIWLFDSKGLVVKNRPEGGINHEKAPYAKDAKPIKVLSDAVDFVKPTAIIGAAAQGRQFTEEIIKKMSKLNKRPIIFALSNPTSKAECTAEEAYGHSEGQAVFASGSPFKKVDFKGRTFHPGQGNNCYIFPAVGLAAVAADLKHIPEKFFLIAAESLSNQVTSEELEEGRVYPKLNRIQEVSFKIAVDLVKYALDNGLSNLYPKPKSVESLVKEAIYDTKQINKNSHVIIAQLGSVNKFQFMQIQITLERSA
ncbi:unnamed protein product [Brachionus calyciflorus]|uniref:Malic enzyme n=1 Tax=Brachionus calyciflorus TaxID=104777 RepID=A0A813XG89_9BILA|nr:unnamed protein product [Brachionus calyciflorus]